MKISVALATYNGENFIEEQLESILAQSRKVDEVIITDDRSTDNTVTIVRSFIEKHRLAETWKCFVNTENKRYAENFRGAIEKTQGDIIFLCDQDDIWVKDRVEKMYSVMSEHSEIGLLNTKHFNFHDKTEAEGEVYKTTQSVTQVKLNRRNRFLQYPGCVMCFRRSFYEEVKRYWYKDWAHDEFLWCMAVIAEECYYYDYCGLLRRLHSNQTSGHIGRDRKKRIAFLINEKKGSEVLLEIAKGRKEQEKIKLCNDFIKTETMRLQLVQEKKIHKAIQLLLYLPYYSHKKSYFIELLMAMRKE
jgi:glycosyltransferase involved in cell wall biosynthesis